MGRPDVRNDTARLVVGPLRVIGPEVSLLNPGASEPCSNAKEFIGPEAEEDVSCTDAGALRGTRTICDAISTFSETLFARRRTAALLTHI